MIQSIGVVSPGMMGAAVGRSLTTLGSRVVVAGDGRSQRSLARVREAGLEDVGTLSELVRSSDLILSIVPPAAALAVAAALAGACLEEDRRPIVVDANAVSPARSTEIASIVEEAGLRYVDGGIVGGPPRPGGRTDLFLSGAGADELADELCTADLVVTSLGDDPTAASALKMCFAAWTKGTSALLIAIRAVARRQGVEAALIELWGRAQPAVLARSEGEGGTAARAWRWVDEMSEIARTFEDAGLPGGAAASASLVYERLGSFKDADAPPSLDELLAAVLS